MAARDMQRMEQNDEGKGKQGRWSGDRNVSSDGQVGNGPQKALEAENVREEADLNTEWIR